LEKAKALASRTASSVKISRRRGDGRSFGEGLEAQAPFHAAEIIGQSG
jgi:hypothetical protein